MSTKDNPLPLSASLTPTVGTHPKASTTKAEPYYYLHTNDDEPSQQMLTIIRPTLTPTLLTYYYLG